MHELKRGLTVLVLFGLAALAASGASAQSLSPMEKKGPTPTAEKGFRLNVGNPYRQRLTFIAVPMDPDFNVPIADVSVRPAEFRLVPGASRTVLLRFKIDPEKRERTIGLCIMPKDLGGSILPRVCGRYTGFMRGAGG
jgi:hypothetical protein